jgi:ketosteroid isomerase-like protein
MQASKGRTTAEATLAEADAAWAAAAAAGEVERILDFWAEDAVNFFPGKPPAFGKAAITKLVRGMRARDGFSLGWHAENVCVAASGDMGYTSGPFEMSIPLDDGGTVRQAGNYLVVWKKDDNDNWKCAVEASVVVPAA